MEHKTHTSQGNNPILNSTALCAAVFAAAVLLRFYCATGDLWLDEVWSIVNIGKVSSLSGIFTHVRSYNNHFLNSIFIYVMGPDAPMMMYRLPALIGSIAALIFAFLIAQRDGWINALFALMILGFSYFFVMLSSESRGYGLVMGLSYGALYYAIKILEENDWRFKTITILWVFMILGFLAHLTFLHFFNGLAAWSIYNLMKNNASMKEGAIKFVKLYLAPAVFIIMLYFFSIQNIIHENGPVRSFLPTLHKLFYYMLGFPFERVFQYLSILISCGLAGFGVYLYKKTLGSIWTFFVTIVLISPAIVFMTIFAVNIFAPRHFFMNVLFFPLLVSKSLSYFFSKDQMSRFCVLCAVGLFLFAQVTQFIRFSEFKRGTYAQALDYIVAASAGNDVSVASDHDFRNMFLVQFYQPRILGAEKIHYVKYSPEIKDAPDFFLLHDFDSRAFPRKMTVGIGEKERVYLLQKVFRYDDQGMSGYDWYIYQRAQGGNKGEGRREGPAI